MRKTLLCFALTLGCLISFAAPGNEVREWIRLGWEALDEGDDLKAASYYMKCSEAVCAGENSRVTGSAVYNVARVYHQSGDLAEAEKYILKSINLSKALGYTSILPPRYSEQAEIYLEMGNADKALQAARDGLVYAKAVRNPNMISQLQIIEADALDALGANPADVQSLYEEAVTRLKRKGAGKVKFHEVFYKLGNNALKQKDTLRACEYYKSMLDKNWWGGDDLQFMKAARALAELVPEAAEAASYAAIADSLSYAPEFQKFANAMALSSLEFPRREREAEIARQKTVIATSIIISILLLAVIVLLVVFLMQRSHMLNETEAKNANLVKLSLQKDRLLAIAKANAEKSANAAEIEAISEDVVPLPQVKLTPREIEIAHLASQGLQNKEIAARLDISPLTVGVHKNNLYRKLGIGNNIELLRYMQKVGL